MLTRHMLRVLSQVRANGFEVTTCELQHGVNILIFSPEHGRETSFGVTTASEPVIAEQIARDYLTETQRERLFGHEHLLLAGSF